MKVVIAAVCLLFIAETAAAGNVSLEGTWSYNINQFVNTLQIAGDKIINAEAGGTSGTLKIIVYLTQFKYSGEPSITGYALGELMFNPLEGGFFYENINNVLIYQDPPPGMYFVTLVLTEYEDNSYYMTDYVNFDGSIIILDKK